MASRIRLALIQLTVGSKKEENLKRAAEKVNEAAKKAQLVCLPECFNSPYGTQYFEEYAEDISGITCEALSAMSKQNSVFLVGGSFPERQGQQLYNTCTIWNRDGAMMAKYRKVHLFDIDVPGKISFKESKVLSAGNGLTTVNILGCKVGVGVCYDIRFSELAKAYCDMGCKLLLYPGAFNMTTGPAHWELLLRACAVQNQVYAACVSPARIAGSSYVAWGHSTVVDPWGKVVATTEHGEDIVYADIDLDYVDQVREMIPLRRQRRKDVYELASTLGTSERESVGQTKQVSG